MKRWSSRLLLAVICWFGSTAHSPAPLIFQPGEGWTYEAVGESNAWRKDSAKDQLDAAKAAFEAKDISLALKSARRTISAWPSSDYKPEAQYLVGRCYEARGDYQRAFKEYQIVVEKYPLMPLFNDVLQRQFDIANRFLAGQRFRLWGILPLFRSMDKTAAMYEKIVKAGPFSDVGPPAQLNIGMARTKERDYAAAVKAYERALYRYNDRPAIAADATFNVGLSYWKQAKKAEYDQTTTASAIAFFNDFLTLYPYDPRAKEAQKRIDEMRTEQARGCFEIARFYEKKKKIQGAVIYYNEVSLLDPTSRFAEISRARIAGLRPPANGGPK